MSITITSSFGSIADTKIAEFEGKYGLHLPDDYRTFLKTFNGGMPSPRTFNVPDLNQDVLVDIFFGIGLERDFDLETWLREYRDEMPKGFLIIGADPGANLILLADGQNERGVFYWDHSFFFEQSNERENTYLIGDSFSEFLSSLK